MSSSGQTGCAPSEPADSPHWFPRSAPSGRGFSFIEHTPRGRNSSKGTGRQDCSAVR
jgi:hypothetical protein